MRLIAIVVLTIAVLSRAGAAETPKYPPMFPYPGAAEITLEDILPAAMDNLEAPGYVPGMKAGEKVLIVTDRSVDPLVKEAFYVAAWRLGATQVDSIELQGHLDISDPAEIILKIFETNWWPQWLWDAAAGYDRLIPLAYFNPVNLMEATSVPGKGWITTSGPMRPTRSITFCGRHTNSANVWLQQGIILGVGLGPHPQGLRHHARG